MIVRKLIFPAFTLGLFLTSGVSADCQAEDPNFQLASSPILRDQGIDATAPNGENWKEDHCSTGELVKVGCIDGPPPGTQPGDPDYCTTATDPRKQVGTWIPERRSFVTYNYGDPGGPYRWKLYTTGSPTVGAVGDKLCWEKDNTDRDVVAIGTLEALSGPCPPPALP